MSFMFLLLPWLPLVVSAMLLAVAAFWGFGLLASVEPRVSVARRIGLYRLRNGTFSKLKQLAEDRATDQSDADS